ncbi:MAG: ABC transporter permease [Fimbriimonadaceae bacterium]|nr:ABC transporter permease [Chthonomonadaceae bacterium]MCO5296000.1 ABC transporter permease [Fimbriimonadaceae bacterium]
MNWKLLALVIGAVALLAAAILATDVAPLEALQTLLRGSLGSPRAIGGTLKETTPLLIAGLAVFLALRAGLFNIGVEGQLLVGAMTCTVVVLRLPGVIGVILGVAAGMVAGAAWAFPAGWIKAYRGGHEVITTIMLNSVAALLTTALVAGPLKAPGQESTTTASIPDALLLPAVASGEDWSLSLALVIGVVLTGAMAWWLRSSVGGYELQAVGANPTAAETAGVSSRRVTTLAMMASGALGGLAGALQVLAYEGRFYSGFSPGYGFDALGVALLAGASAWGVLPAALLFGVLAKGGTAVQILGVPKGITGVVLGLLILIFAAVRYRRVQCPA